ncbi:MAG TPA: hypothetical protein DCM05_09315 [Elusimicrobia bacterium]|nr:hypothetical protein [Elusimicrobiota bacterium]
MRPLAVVLSLSLLHLQAAPVFAQFHQQAAAPGRAYSPVVPAVPIALGAGLGSLTSAPTLSFQTLPTVTVPKLLKHAPPAAAASLRARPILIQAVEARRQPLPARIAQLQVQAAKDLEALPSTQGEASQEVARENFDRLLGAKSIRAHADAVLAEPALPVEPALSAPAPAPQAAKTSVPSPDKAATRRYLAGTAAFKFGMEALNLAMPLLALTVFGQAAWAAALAAAWGLSQALFGSLAGGFVDRHSPTKVLSWAMGLQSLAGAGLLGLFALDHFLPALLPFAAFNPVAAVALYALAGGFLGVADVARQVIPPALVGSDEKALKEFDARTHIAYEVAGVAGAFFAGWVIKTFGVGAALLIHPPLYLLAAIVFSTLAAKASPAPAPPDEGGGPRQALKDVLEGARTLFSNPVFRAAFFAIVLPFVIHRVFESLLVPVFAKTLLADPSKAAWMLGFSNAGELLGAFLLSRSIRGGHVRRSYQWVRWMALGTLALWALCFTQSLPVLLPLIAFSSVSWAASDLSLRGKLQAALEPAVRGRSFSFISAATFLSVLAVSLGVGFLFDALPAAAVLIGVNAAFTLAAAAMLWAAGKLKR